MREKCLHYYYGDGKGKTTAAMGLALRASGSGLRICIVQFLKSGDSGECSILSHMPNVTLLAGKVASGFSSTMSEAQKADTLDLHNRHLFAIRDLLQKDSLDMLILDEVGDALTLGLLDSENLISLLDENKNVLEIILTGHQPLEQLILRAHYVTEMRMHRHPYTKGLSARKGIEF